ncbi:MAG: hypothetical protein A2W93_08530 [Bacteroidetes bacterium GWF2_43_63]|nr:MAG: hypothetical protein A2W93_08530 [Bacteroidetes bacterium GWF2_43_63]
MYKVKDRATFAPASELLVPGEPLIQIGDNLTINVYSNKGEKLLEPLSAASQQGAGESSPIVFTVDSAGYIALPIVGQTLVAGLTTDQCEKEIVALFAKSVVEPYVQISLLNKRIFFMTGGTTQTATVIPYVNENTTLVDVISSAGGIKEGKAYSIRLIRNTTAGLKIYAIDLSDFSQAKYSFVQVLPNDIVYVEPQHRPLRKFIESLAPYLTLVSTGLLIYNFTR